MWLKLAKIRVRRGFKKCYSVFAKNLTIGVMGHKLSLFVFISTVGEHKKGQFWFHYCDS
jgi:hypothetical protein